MRTVEVALHVDGGVAAEHFDQLVAVERFAELTDVVRSIEVHERTSDSALTTWEVHFRDGILKWTERESIDQEARTLSFTQTTGDFAHFAGMWQVEDHVSGCVVRLTVDFDLGMPTLAAMLDPLAESALRENAVSIVRALSPSEDAVAVMTPTAI